MVQLVPQRTALVLYGVLLVLPSLVLGGLHWRQLALVHETQLETVPRDVSDAARRLSAGLKERLDELVASESARVPFEYRRQYYPTNVSDRTISFSLSPLSARPRPAGILGWFQISNRSSSGIARTWSDSAEDQPDIQVGSDDPPEIAAVRTAELMAAAQEFARLSVGEPIFWRLRRVPHFERSSFSLPVTAINLSTEDDLDCLRGEASALRQLGEHRVEAKIYDFELRLFRDSRGEPHLVASRVVEVESMPELKSMPTCFDTAAKGVKFVQGFFVDPQWLFRELPRAIGARVLDPTQEFYASPQELDAAQGEYVFETIQPVRALGIESEKRDQSFGSMCVAVNTWRMRDRYRSQMLHLGSVAAMLVISLATGLVLLLRSVTRDLEAARRTENFVAAVTHELRTPLSAIRLYGEMLEDGWVDDAKKQREYYRRIVRETQRLETLVESVLEKGRLTSRETPVEPGDLNRVVESLRGTLIGPDEGPARDVEFVLADELPAVRMYPEGVRSIVVNLVENARKYAPVAEGSESIRVATRALAGEVVLEVMDRGPGIPESERERVFEAFYRVGNETTRTAKGTGLGLHLVALQTQAMGGHVEVLAREGGGTTFRVHFVVADEAT